MSGLTAATAFSLAYLRRQHHQRRGEDRLHHRSPLHFPSTPFTAFYVRALSFCYILSASVIYQLTPLSLLGFTFCRDNTETEISGAHTHSPFGQFVAQFVANRRQTLCIATIVQCTVLVRAHHLFHGQSLLLLLYIGAHSMSLVQCPRLDCSVVTPFAYLHLLPFECSLYSIAVTLFFRVFFGVGGCLLRCLQTGQL